MNDAHDNQNAPHRKKFLGYFDPEAVGALDPLSRRILAIEMANPGISADKIKAVGKLTCDRHTIYKKRANPLYQKLLYESQKSALELIQDAKIAAIRKLRNQIDSGDERIAQKAALFFAEGSKEIEIKKAEFELELELQRRQIHNEPKHEVHVIMEGVSVIGKTRLPDDAIIQIDAPTEPPSDQQALPPPRRKQTYELMEEDLTSPEQPSSGDSSKADSSSQRVSVIDADDNVMGGIE